MTELRDTTQKDGARFTEPSNVHDTASEHSHIKQIFKTNFLHTANNFKILCSESVCDLAFFIRKVFKKHKTYSGMVF